jgi:pimeloyl-ACP methyl ester carboxylesterase
MTEAVILVPGIMGSELRKGDEVIWPGTLAELLLPYAHMEDLLQDNLRPTDVIRRFSISEQYDDLISFLEACGFSEDHNPATLKVFPYDWRKDNALAASLLADVVDAMAASLGRDPEIDLVAHSMGGLVGRCYLESGSYSLRPGFSAVKRLITIGTPHRGAPMALAAALGQKKRLFLSAQQVQRLANDPRFPSVYQLMPPLAEPFAWNRASTSRHAPVDVFASAAALGLHAEGMASAKTFHDLLDPSRRPKHVRYFCFAGTRQDTANSIQVTFSQQGAGHLLECECEDAGDGTVPTWSGSLPGVQMEPVGGVHGELYKDGRLKRVLADLLGKPGVLLAVGTTPQISVLHKVVEPGAATRVTLDFPQDTTTVNGELRLRWATDKMGVQKPAGSVVAVFPLSYAGPAIDHLSLFALAPQHAGAYEFFFAPSGEAETVASTELLVQSVNPMACVAPRRTP